MINKEMMQLTPNDMSFRKIYWSHFLTGKLSRVFRPFKRLGGDPQGYCPGQKVVVKCLEKIGASWCQVAPIFTPGQEVLAEILGVSCKKLKEYTTQDFIGSSPDICDRQSLQYHLGTVYNLSLEEMNGDALVTAISFKILPNANCDFMPNNALDALVEQKIISFAFNPQKNPKTLKFEKIALALLAEDYPAKTPAMWNTVYETFGMNCASIAVVVKKDADLRVVTQALREDPRYIGGGVGVGLKDIILPSLDSVEDIAEQMQSVNLIQKNGNILKGFNTDGWGFLKAVSEYFESKNEKLENKKAILLGAGGTANALAFVLVKSGIRLTLINRTVSKAEELAKKLNMYFRLDASNSATGDGEDNLIKYVSDANMIINTTTKGATGEFAYFSAMSPAKLPATAGNLAENYTQTAKILAKTNPQCLMVDIVLKSEATPMINIAKAGGFPTMNGVPMVINQGVEAFWILHEAEVKALGKTKDDIAKIMKQAAGF